MNNTKTFVQCPYCFGYNTRRTPMMKDINGEISIIPPEEIKRFTGTNSSPQEWISMIEKSEYDFLGYCNCCQARFIIEKNSIIRMNCEESELKQKPFSMTIEDVFPVNISHSAWANTTIVAGRIESGFIQIGDNIIISSGTKNIKAIVLGVEMCKKMMPYAEFGDNCGILLNVNKEMINPGDVLSF